MSKTSIHYGTAKSISPDVSAGLLFLKAMLPALDSLGPFHDTPDLASFLAEDATFTIANNPPVKASDVLEMLPKRASRLSKFQHNLETAWDIELQGGKRTVMYESTSVTVFKDDKDGVEVPVKEFNIVELAGASDGKGYNGLVVVRARAFLDGAPVLKRMEQVQEMAGS